MFIVTAKLSKSKLIAGVVAAGVLLCAIVVLVSQSSWKSVSATPSSKVPNPKNVSNSEQRVAFLGGYGWDVNPEPIEFEEVLIPETFDEVFTTYNDLQKSQGFDLTKLQGKRVMRYTYAVTNYPHVKENVHATLLIYKNAVVGGDLSSVNLDGFMHGFAKQP